MTLPASGDGVVLVLVFTDKTPVVVFELGDPVIAAGPGGDTRAG